MTLKRQIKSTALTAGFSLCGITSADAVEEFDNLNCAINEGRTARMNYLSRDPDGRCSPRSILADARSVICCAYFYGEEKSLNPSNKIARFARVEDYHIVVRKKLEAIVELILKIHPDARCKICVDTSPILEKALAQRAGLGWVGKNTILINEDIGSFFVLGEIITDIEFAPDKPKLDLCGDCRACMDACPTKALVAPKALDAGKCISYFTTVKKEDIPTNFKKLINNDTYGCDICQEACPHNKR